MKEATKSFCLFLAGTNFSVAVILLGLGDARCLVNWGICLFMLFWAFRSK